MLKRLYYLIAGDTQNYGFEHRIFNLSSFIITVFCIQGTLINYLLGLHIATVWLAIGGTVISATLFYIARVKAMFSPALLIVFSIAAIVILGPLHFFNGASSGPTIYLLIMMLNIFLLIAPSGLQVWIYGIFGISILSMLVLEYYFPGWITAYASASQRIADHITVMIYSLFFTMLVIRLFRISYDREQQTILQQKIELEDAYRVTTEKNIYIESLIRELHHRVKNNLQVVSSLLSLQSNRLEDENARKALQDGRSRVDAMAMIHQRLYMDKQLASVNIQDYIEELSVSIAGSYGYSPASVITDIVISREDFDIDRAIPIGLIVNELITNAFKHAFKGITDPKVHINLLQEGDMLELRISDNGTGMKTKDSGPATFGIKLVHILVDQLDARLQVLNHPGTEYRIKMSA
ncbi:MAG: hypothetical protein GC171_03915 [Terrimonas sp.]|nr:hypothetical protein [Terrimonas sp.]